MVSLFAMKIAKAVPILATVLVTGLLSLTLVTGRGQAEVATGPLRVNNCNSRYFSNPDGNPVYLTGSHTWTNLQDRSLDPVVSFDFIAYLDLLQKYHHNFIKLWTMESAAWEPTMTEKVRHDPLPYLRVGPGTGRDGLPKFDLTRFNEQYFGRLRERLIAARDRGIYVAVMLFQGWSIEKKWHEKRSLLKRAVGKLYRAIGIEPPAWDPNNPWNGHPFNRANNINGINGDLNRDGEGLEIHALTTGEILKLQEQYVRKMVDTVNDLDNVLYEISNESRGESTGWQYHMIRFIHAYEATKPKQHPVLMTYQWPAGPNAPLFQSPAEAVSPGVSDWAYRTDPPLADGSKVIILDTDHLWGEGGDAQWVWKTFMRGGNPLFMDRLADLTGNPQGDIPRAEEIRVAMGQTLKYSKKIGLAKMLPRNDICSTTYCLVNARKEYLAYLPGGGPLELSLEKEVGPFTVEWFNPSNGKTSNAGTVFGGRQHLVAPFEGDAVVYLKAKRAIQDAGQCRKP